MSRAGTPLRIVLVGIGTGNPDHLTAQAAAALNGADLILIPRKGPDKADLADVRHLILSRVLTRAVPVAEFDMPTRGAGAGYLRGVEDWHDAIAERWQRAIAGHEGPKARVALMVWGDPMLYDSTLRIAGRLTGALVSVVPGITSLQALCAAHGIPLNELAEPVLITTGRQLRGAGWPASAPDTMAVLLDGEGAFAGLDPAGVSIWWAAYVGMAEEILLSGPLAEVGPQILARRAEARAKAGWIMDIYLMRRKTGAG
ncbi:MAG: precorrin-6A synthase (deacetylating) [Paracoccaceae bacterium]